MEDQFNTGGGCMRVRGCSKAQDNKLNTYDWLSDIAESDQATDYVEVQFKNTRKGYYLNSTKIPLEKGDVVAVESSPGHDIGTVTLTGKLVLLQMRKYRVKSDAEVRRVYRKAKPADLEKYEEAKAREHETMIRSRKIAEGLGLQMKIGDVEYQGDGNKAIFYYIADERVDFRQLIKDLAEAFRVRIEMKQIGARQEAGRIGGIGPCGRELCCSGWMSNFVSVSTGSARLQDISLNPQKLAGQCAKLKCCLNYEVDTYAEAQRKLPSRDVPLETKDNTYYHFKTDIFKGLMTYSTDKVMAANLVTIPAERAFEVIAMNRRGNKPPALLQDEEQVKPKRDAHDILDESVTRFDHLKRNKKGRPNGGGNQGNPRNNGNGSSAENRPNQGARNPEGRNNNRPNNPNNREGQNQRQGQPRGEHRTDQARTQNNNRRERNGRPNGGAKPANNGKGNEGV